MWPAAVVAQLAKLSSGGSCPAKKFMSGANRSQPTANTDKGQALSVSAVLTGSQ